MTPLANTLAIDREMFSGSVDAGFVLALPFAGGGWGAYAWNKNTSAKLCAKNAGGAYAGGQGVFAGHYGIYGVGMESTTQPPLSFWRREYQLSVLVA